MIVLDEGIGNSEISKRTLIVTFQEESAIVAEDARFEQKNSGQRCSKLFHEIRGRLINALAQQLQQISSIAVVSHGLRQCVQLRGGNVSGSIRDLFGASDHQALPLL